MPVGKLLACESYGPLGIRIPGGCCVLGGRRPWGAKHARGPVFLGSEVDQAGRVPHSVPRLAKFPITNLF